MSLKSLNSFERLIKLLQSTGYIQHCLRNGTNGYINGPAGTLLRHNITRTWWDRMVTKSEAAFPITGHNLDPLMFYHDIFEMMNKTVPFSIAHVSSSLTSQNTNNQKSSPPSQNTNNQKSSLPSQESENSIHLKQLLNPLTETSMKYLHVCPQSSVSQTFDQVVNTRMNWWKLYSSSSSNFTQVNTVEESMLSRLHIQYAFPWGQETIETIHNKGDKGLIELEERTGTSCKYNNGKKLLYPNYIECDTTVEMAVAVFLTDAFTEKPLLDDKTVTRQVLQLDPTLAPFKVAINRDGTKHRQIHEVATYICRELRKAGIQILDTRDTTNTLASQIERYDEMGVPFTVIVSDYTIETGAIYLRNRDTTINETLAINKLLDYITRHVNHQH